MSGIVYTDSGPSPKMHVAVGNLPSYINPSQAPTKKAPWRQIRESNYISSVSMVLPEEFYRSMWSKLETTKRKQKYATVIMKLEDILQGDFFTNYIKTPGSNILMLSEGIPGVENTFSLRDGILRLDLGKEDYQRAGLQGQPAKNTGGRKHTKERFTIELNLRTPSMIKGKPGYDRLLHACKNSLNKSLVWLFRDPKNPALDNNKDHGPLLQHHPIIKDLTSTIFATDDLMIPSLITKAQIFSGPPPLETLEDYYEIVEWMDLVALRSPRVQQDDNPDPYLSRYSIPEDEALGGPPEPARLKVLKWTGLLDPDWVIELLVDIIKQSRNMDSKDWVSLSVTTYATEAVGRINGYAILLQSSVGSDDGSEDGTNVMDVDDSAINDTTTAEVDQVMTTDDGSKTESHGGLQRFTCFQFVNA